MPVTKAPQFSPNVADRILKEHGLEGKVTPAQLADAASIHDTKNQGYISADEFAAAAADFKRQLGGDAAGQAPVSGGAVHSPMFARGAVIAGKADLKNPEVAYAKERVLANAGAGARFGELAAGEGLRAFTIDDAALAKIKDPALKDKLATIGAGTVFGVLTTGDEPQLTIALAKKNDVRVAAAYDLLSPEFADVLGGGADPLQATAALFGGADVIALGGEKASWSLGSGDWTTGQAFKSRKNKQHAALASREAAHAARLAARDVAMAGPKTVEAFEAAGVVAVPHSAAEKKALLKLVQDNAGEDKTFPNPDDSYYGLHVFLHEGAEAAHTLAFATAVGAGGLEFDPAKHSVLTTVKSFDEAQVGTFVVDRETGKVLLADETNAVDYDESAVTVFFPEVDVDNGFDAHVIGTLASRGESLGVVAGANPPDNMDFAGWLDA